ncbi:prenyltransferase [Sanguibacter suaedae]|uniref:Prenyltransferase n=1 Tax=Sanguibacter suaedae TaxID=2795737 RepID=A0A934MD21_9MICO|nr:prenyltransferase [Sanguibacter suaedae]MBI9114404.1 prenyltransferase [Sanguibacter suaedae]
MTAPHPPHADARPQGAGTVVGRLIASSRPISWINTAYPFAAAYLMTGGALDWTLAVGTLYFLVPYNLLMYGINDVFDYESDLRNPRKGGVEGIVLDTSLHRTTLWAAVLSNVPFLVYLVAVGTWQSTVALTVSVLAVVAYSAPGLRFKERPVLDSATSSTHFVSPAVVGLLLVTSTVQPAVLTALGAFFLWGMASQAFGAVQDVAADRAGGISSVATVLGSTTTVRGTMVLYALSSALLLTTGWPGALAAVVPVLYLVNVAPYRSLPDSRCEDANAGWRRFLWLNMVSGFLVTQLLIWIALR